MASREFYGDRVFVWTAWFAARKHAEHASANTFYARFAHEPPLPSDVEILERANAGAFHGADIPYGLRTLDRLAWPWTADDRRMADLLSAYWINFAHTSDPNGEGLPAWPRFTTDDRRMLLMRPEPEVIEAVPSAERMAFWDRFYGSWRGSAASLA